GTYPLPEAQLDRFLLKVLIGYPGHADEVAMVEAISQGRVAAAFDLSQVARVLDAEGIVALQQATAATTLDAAVIDYAVRIVAATRTWPGIALGAGPRGRDRKSTRLNSSHVKSSYAVFCLKKKKGEEEK